MIDASSLPPPEVVVRFVAARELQKLRPKDYAAIEQTVVLNSWIPHVPYPKQAEFLALAAEEAFYGGAAGGGKSDALLMAAMQYVEVPGYSAILFRRTYTDLSLPGAIMQRAHEWLRGTQAHWNDTAKTYTFPSGATLTFAYLDTEQDKYRYQSAEFQFVGFDELTQFTETQYTYMFSRMRRLKGASVPLRMRAASNPGNLGHVWVKARFIESDDPTRRFIPARMDDNPSLDRVEYEKALGKLDNVTRKQLRDGDWEVSAEGKKFRRAWFEIVDHEPKGLTHVRYWDLAATLPTKPGQDPDWTAGVKLGKDQHGTFYVCDVVRLRDVPAEVEKAVAQAAKMDGHDALIYMEQEPGSAGVITIDHYRRNVLQGYYFIGHKETGDKQHRANTVSSKAEKGLVKIVAGAWNAAFLSELEQFPTQGVHDDQVDGLSGAYRALADRVWESKEKDEDLTPVQEFQKRFENAAKARIEKYTKPEDDEMSERYRY